MFLGGQVLGTCPPTRRGHYLDLWNAITYTDHFGGEPFDMRAPNGSIDDIFKKGYEQFLSNLALWMTFGVRVTRTSQEYQNS